MPLCAACSESELDHAFRRTIRKDSGSRVNHLSPYGDPRPTVGIRQWWRNLGPWSSEHPAGWGVATGVLIGLIWFGVAYAVDPDLGFATVIFPVIFGAVIGFGYYMRARVDQSSL
jgi:hypothetical protein